MADSATFYGLVYPQGFLDSLNVLQKRPAPHSPIYTLTAAQYAELYSQYSLADVDDSVLFPFLHGLEGDNVAQNLFFAHTRGRESHTIQPKVPRYRGLMSVACPTDEEESVGNMEADSSGSSDDGVEQLGYEDDVHTPAYREDFAQSSWAHTRNHSSSFSSATSSSSPLSASTTATSLWNDSQHPNGATSCDDSALTESPPPRSSSSTCRLLSSVLPHEILSSSETAFVTPNIPDGISLRNFGTQVPIYATLSDIVLYSPNGVTRRICDLAERIKEAVENKAVERNGGRPVQPGASPLEFGNGNLSYNVFIVTDSFDVFERDFPELISADKQGNAVRHIDFMAREKEEMRELTQATLICQNLWLGNTADVPPVTMASLHSDVDPFDTGDNTQGWDICIECRDDAYFPTPAHLRHAEDHIAKLDAVWAAQCTPAVHSPPHTDSPKSESSTPPLSPTLMGLSNLRVNTASPSPFRPPSSLPTRDVTMRSRSASPSPAAVAAGRPIRERSGSYRHSSPSPPSSQPRPPPNPRSIVHLSFPSSPPSNPHTTTQLLNMLTFLARYADPSGYTSYAGANAMGFSGNANSSKRRGSLSAFSSSSATTSAYSYQPQPPTAISRPLRILLHSMDGYTETSVLALSYIMHSKRCSLPEAYLELQIERSRSFFVCPGDMGVLRRIESILALAMNGADSDRKREEKVARREKERERVIALANGGGGAHNTVVASNASVIASADANNSGSSNRWGKWSGSWRSGSLALGSFGSFSAANPNVSGGEASAMTSSSAPSNATGGVASSAPTSASFASRSPPTSPPMPTETAITSSNSNPTHMHPQVSRTGRARALTSPIMLPSYVDHSAWFMDPRFDGSFPSRVLPHLYLGNLNHASNAYMLHALGITHVVSVGECALVPPICPMPRPGSNGVIEPGTQVDLGMTSGSANGHGSFVYGSGPNGQGSLWIEEREGRIKVLDIKGVSDDGIDSLRPQFAPICDWIEKARQENGKVLVHCRVGVSRSATVTIAYVMKYHHMSLVDAYLLVRSRRLSILIQPNMRLLYNLVGWEIEIAKEKAAKQGLDHVPPEGRLSWPCLAREVHKLNERYLQ